MPTSQFQSFGIGAGAFVNDPATWAANPVRNLGYPPGILPKENLNTALRQASSMAFVLASFIADNQATNVLDDGNLATLKAQLKLALDNLYGGVAAGVFVANQTASPAFGTSAAVCSLFLPPGQWLIDAQGGIFESAYFANQLSVDGTVVLNRQNYGDPGGTCISPVAGFLTVNIVGARNVPISWAQESGGNSFAVHLRGLAMKVG